MTAPLVVLVEFELRPDALARFLPLMLANAETSLAREPGCRRFDVLAPTDRPERITLYEIYDDAAAFRSHCQSAHFLRFAGETATMIASKRVVELSFAGPVPAEPPLRGAA